MLANWIGRAAVCPSAQWVMQENDEAPAKVFAGASIWIRSAVLLAGSVFFEFLEVLLARGAGVGGIPWFSNYAGGFAARIGEKELSPIHLKNCLTQSHQSQQKPLVFSADPDDSA